MKFDLVLSMFAGDKVPPGVPFIRPIRVVQWNPPPSSGHPSWTGEADSLRQGAWRKGPLLPALLRRYAVRLEDVERICVLGFSAGSNNGVRECLRSEDDRRRIDTVLAVDGLHPTLAQRPGDPPRGGYAAWDQELEPFAAFAERAAFGAAAMVATASAVAAPTKTNGQTARVLTDLVGDVLDRTSGRELAPALLPDDFPTSGDPVRPDQRADVGSFSALWYPGTDKSAHIAQGTHVVRDLWRDVLSRRWSPETADDLPASKLALVPAGSSSSSSSGSSVTLGRRFSDALPLGAAAASLLGSILLSR